MSKFTLIVLCIFMFVLLSMQAGAMTPAWVTTLGGYAMSSPSVYDGKVFVGSDDGKVYCLDLATGAQNWMYNCRPDQYPWDNTILRVHTRPAVYGADVNSVRIYASTTNGYLYTINMDGTLYWRQRPTLDENGTAALWDGWVYFGNSGQVHRLDAATGGIHQTSPAFGSLIQSSVSIPGTNLVWYGSNDGNIYCLQASDLSVVRAILPGGSQPIISSPYADLRTGTPRIYIGTGNSKFRCIHATLFTDLWSADTDDAVSASPWVDVPSGKVIVGCDDGKLYTFNKVTGASTGTFQAEAALKSPVSLGGVAYVGDINGKLYAIRLSDMSLLWTYSTGDTLTDTAFGEAGGHVYLIVGSNDGKVYGFQVQ